MQDDRVGPLVLHSPYSGPAYLSSTASQTIAPVPLDFGRDRSAATPAVVRFSLSISHFTQEMVANSPCQTDFFKAKRRRALPIQKDATNDAQSPLESSTKSTTLVCNELILDSAKHMTDCASGCSRIQAEKFHQVAQPRHWRAAGANTSRS